MDQIHGLVGEDYSGEICPDSDAATSKVEIINIVPHIPG